MHVDQTDLVLFCPIAYQYPILMANTPNPFEVLGIDHLAAAQLAKLKKPEIDRIYRQLTLDCHPDKGGSADDFCMVHEAYELINTRLKLIAAIRQWVDSTFDPLKTSTSHPMPSLSEPKPAASAKAAAEDVKPLPPGVFFYGNAIFEPGSNFPHAS